LQPVLAGVSHSDTMDSTAHCSSGDEVELQKPKSRLLMFRDRLLSPHLKEYRPHAAESLHQRQVYYDAILLYCI